MRANRSRRRGFLLTGVGVVLTALMLFPVYWMVNESFTRDQDMRIGPAAKDFRQCPHKDVKAAVGFQVACHIGDDLVGSSQHDVFASELQPRARIRPHALRVHAFVHERDF